MAKIIVRGAYTDVEIHRYTETPGGRAFFVLACDKGAWCELEPVEAETVWDWETIMGHAVKHADARH